MKVKYIVMSGHCRISDSRRMTHHRKESVLKAAPGLECPMSGEKISSEDHQIHARAISS